MFLNDTTDTTIEAKSNSTKNVDVEYVNKNAMLKSLS